MTAHDATLIERQRQLVVRSAELRVVIAYEARPLVAPLAFADRVVNLAKGARDWAAANPLWVVAGLAALAVAKPRRAWRWARRGWSLWRLSRFVRAFAVKAR